MLTFISRSARHLRLVTGPASRRRRTGYGAESRGDIRFPPVERRDDPHTRWGLLGVYLLVGVLCLVFWALVVFGLVYLIG